MSASAGTWTIRRVGRVDEGLTGELSDLLRDCVEGGASVGFMLPLSVERCAAFWRRVAEDVERGARVLLVAEDGRGGVCGTVQLVLELPENQPHRADLVKMLVHSGSRRRGLGEALMRAAEREARVCGRSLLVLDAVTGGDASRLYERLGWVRAGDIPGYALHPGGGLCGTTYYYKPLAQGTGG